MKKLLFLVALLSLLLVSTAILADGRPTGLRIGRLVSGGGTNVELDVTVTGTNYYYGGFYSTVWLGNEIDSWFYGSSVSQFESNNFSVPLPWAIDWGDGSQFGHVRLFSDSSSGPWRGTFAHTYSVPGTYQVTVGDALCCDSYYQGYAVIYTGNVISGTRRYVYSGFGSTYNTFYDSTAEPLAVTANATVTTGTGIPALNIYGLLAMAFVLVGAGLLVYRKPQNLAT